MKVAAVAHFWATRSYPAAFGLCACCVLDRMSTRIIIQVDNDRRAETGAFVKNCLPHGYREVRCRHVSDSIFKRGQGSRESGYRDEDDRISSHGADGDWYYSDNARVIDGELE